MEILSDKRPIPEELKKLQGFVKLMDAQFRIPGTNFRFGIDPLLNLIPYGGAAVGYAIGIYLMFAMYKNGASSKVMGKMIWNVSIDALVGAIPVLGTFFDFYYKANKRNMVLAVEHFEEGKHKGSILPYLIPIMIAFLLVLAASIYVTIQVFQFLFQLLGGLTL